MCWRDPVHRTTMDAGTISDRGSHEQARAFSMAEIDARRELIYDSHMIEPACSVHECGFRIDENRDASWPLDPKNA